MSVCDACVTLLNTFIFPVAAVTFWTAVLLTHWDHGTFLTK